MEEQFNNNQFDTPVPPEAQVEPPYGAPPQYGYYAQPVQTKYIVLPQGFTPKTYEEKRGIRRAARICAISFLLLLGISSIWATLYYFIMSLFGYSDIEAYNIISEPAVLQLASVLLSILLFTVPFILTALISGYRVSDLVPLNKPQKGKALPYFLFGMGFCIFANISTSYAGNIFESMGIDYSVGSGSSPEGIFGFLLSAIATAVVPGLVEEFACRGIIFGILKKYGDAFAVIATAVLFGLMHGNFVQIPFAFMVGLVAGIIRVKTGSMIVCFLVHGANNLVSVIIEYLLSGFSILEQNIIYIVFLLVSMLVAILGILMLKGDKKEFALEAPNHECSSVQKYKWFFTHPLIIIFAVLCLLEALAYFVV